MACVLNLAGKEAMKQAFIAVHAFFSICLFIFNCRILFSFCHHVLNRTISVYIFVYIVLVHLPSGHHEAIIIYYRS